MKKILLPIILLFTCAIAHSQSGTITNIQVSQRKDGSGLVDIRFDLSGGAAAYNLLLEASLDGDSTYVPLSGSHIVGDKEQVAPGTRKHVIWNAQESFPNTFSPMAMVKIIATPGQTGTAGQPCPGMPVFTDPRDGKSYPTVQIGDQCWMAENLAYLPSVTMQNHGAYTAPLHYVNGFYGTNVSDAKATSNYHTYGVLYNWLAAMQACPAGWHLPSDTEWTEMENYLISNGYNYDGTATGNKIAKSLATSSGWTSSSNIGSIGNTDYAFKRNATGFSALPGGSIYHNTGLIGYFWTATEIFDTDEIYAWHIILRFDSESVNRGNYDRSFGYSVRCIKD